jgi:OPA family glycerol-3-phosphate transporter-like MFS transporter
MQKSSDDQGENQHFMTMKERKIYNKWRLRVLTSIIFGYGTYYLCRQNFSMIMPAFMEEFGYTKTQLGWVLTIASVVYGIGKFVNGYLSDRSNARYFMVIGLVCSAIITFIMGFSDSLLFLGSFLIINHWFQSMGWPPAARMITHWFAPKELGRKWALGAASHQIGGAVTLIFSGYLVATLGWRYAFFIPSITAIIISIILFNRLRESPKELGLPSVEAYKKGKKHEETEEDRLSNMEIFYRVFANRNMWYICFANMCVYIVRIGIIFWAPLFLKEFKDISLSQAGWQVAAYEVTGLLGGFAAGWLSDKVMHGQRGPVGALFMACLAIALIIFWYIPEDYVYFSTLSLICVGFFVYGPQVLVGVASADFASKKAIGTANGFAGTMGYAGSGLSGICVGALIDHWGWASAFVFFIASALIGAVFFLLTWRCHRSSSQGNL